MRKESKLKIVKILIGKELEVYFNSPIAYVFIGAFLLAGNWLFFNYFFVNGQASLRSYFALLPWIFLFLAPAITMRAWSEEKRSGTIEFLLTLPLSDWQAVLAKFLAALILLALALTLTISLPLTVAGLGALDWGPVVGGYLGGLCLGGLYLAIGLFISSLTKNQIIAFVAGLAACFVLFIVSSSFVLTGLPATLATVANFFGAGSHFDALSRGLIDTRDVLYYVSAAWLFLWLNGRVLASRK